MIQKKLAGLSQDEETKWTNIRRINKNTNERTNIEVEVWERLFLKTTLRPGPGGCSFLDSCIVRLLQNPATLQISLKVGGGHRRSRSSGDRQTLVSTPICSVHPESFWKKEAASSWPCGGCTSREPGCKCWKPSSKRQSRPGKSYAPGLKGTLPSVASIFPSFLSPHSPFLCSALPCTSFMLPPWKYVAEPRSTQLPVSIAGNQAKRDPTHETSKESPGTVSHRPGLSPSPLADLHGLGPTTSV